MDALRQYVLSVTAAALVCAIVQKLLAKKGTVASVGRMLTGLFLTFVVISPFADLQIGDISDFTDHFEADAADAVAAGEHSTRKALSESIIVQTRAYILDKAEELYLDISVEVTVSQDGIPVPVAVRLSGDASPYAKQKLQNIIAEDLGIAKEDQLWI